MGICNSQHKPNTHTHQEDLSQQGTTSNTGDDVSTEKQSHPNRQGNKGGFASSKNNNYSALELGEVKGQASGRSKADIYREMNSSRSVSVFILCFSCALSFPSIDRGQNLNSFLPPPGQRYKG